ncbi:MAG: PfkB family carbohydrate kinase [Chloroflexi bacterium]|nr:PfkB family carbohydrate kinase [Chloroflexota bacterium]
MQVPARLEPIDYLVIGHITIDNTVGGPRLGGSAAYSALTVQALGLRAGIVTAWAEELPLGPLADLPIVNIGADQSTTFENRNTPEGRKQKILVQAPFLEYHLIPEAWRQPRILHLAPVAREVSPRILRYFPDSTLGLTPQGWLREWNQSGEVQVAHWEEADLLLSHADAAVIAREDVGNDPEQIERMAAACPIFVVTEGEAGAKLYAYGEEHQIEAPAVHAVDTTGAGDVFAAAFFIRLHLSGDPLEAARFASQLAARSVQRVGLDSVPNRDEIYDLMAEAL